MNILITGGAGFIGTHLTRDLLESGHEVVILDNFLAQVHGCNASVASDLKDHVRLVVGDVADRSAMEDALSGAQCVIHLAAETGTGQSMYEVSRYERSNLSGTAILLELLTKSSHRRVERIVVASSRSIYGEGAYHCPADGLVYPSPRSSEDKRSGLFDPLCPNCGQACAPVPTAESAPLHPASFYGLTKQVQEQMVLMFGRMLGITSFALRYQNVYGPGQSLLNPYTGILAIFSTLARTGKPLHIFEDGLESRDFVFVEDAVRATRAAALGDAEGWYAVNVGSGVATKVSEVAEGVRQFFQSTSPIEITGAFREGDIRHGLADLSLARRLLNYNPEYEFDVGLRKFLEWAAESRSAVSRYDESLTEMKTRGLLHGRA